MVLVRGHDSHTAVEVGEESTWGTAASTLYRVPILSESIALERDQFPRQREFGNTGALEFLESGRALVRGSITVYPRYDARWFYILLAHAFGTEAVVQDEWLDGSASGSNVANTHSFEFNSTLPTGLTFKIWKSGPNANGTVDTFTGCLISRMVWEQPEDDIARVTFDVIGSGVTNASASGNPATSAGTVFLKARDLSRTNSRVKTGSALANDFSVRSLRLTVDRRIEAEAAFLNDPDNIDKPGVIDTRDIQIELNGQLEQTYGASDTPWTEFLAKTQSQCDIRYTADTVTQGSDPYGIRLHMPAIVWEEVNNNIGEPGANPFTARATAIQGTATAQAGTDESGSDILSQNTTTDLRCFAHVKVSDEPSSDTEFSGL